VSVNWGAPLLLANCDHVESVSCVDLPLEIDVEGATGVPSMEATSQSSCQTKASPSYTECVAQLARVVDEHDEADLEKVASLIGQLAVVIEL
jgi:hypothetical protein